MSSCEGCRLLDSPKQGWLNTSARHAEHLEHARPRVKKGDAISARPKRHVETQAVGGRVHVHQADRVVPQHACWSNVRNEHRRASDGIAPFNADSDARGISLGKINQRHQPRRGRTRVRADDHVSNRLRRGRERLTRHVPDDLDPRGQAVRRCIDVNGPMLARKGGHDANSRAPALRSSREPGAALKSDAAICRPCPAGLTNWEEKASSVWKNSSSDSSRSLIARACAA